MPDPLIDWLEAAAEEMDAAPYIGAEYAPLLREAASDLRAAEQREGELREALEWYANQNRYRIGEWEPDDPNIEPGTVLEDNGQRARSALLGGDKA
jgi:signal transduction histidine kinase